MKKLLLTAVLACVPVAGVAQTKPPAASYQADCYYYAWPAGLFTDSPVSMKPQFGQVKLSGSMPATQAYYDRTTIYSPENNLAYGPFGPSFSLEIGGKSSTFRPKFHGSFILSSAPARFEMCESYLGIGKDRSGTMTGKSGQPTSWTEELSAANVSFARFEGANLKTNCSAAAVRPGTPFILNTKVIDSGIQVGLSCWVTLNLPAQSK